MMCRQDLCCKSYRMQTGQLLTQATKDKRLLNSTKLLNKLKDLKESNMLWFFSDEKNFCQDQVHNTQNHQWIAMCPNDVPRVKKTKFPNTIMFFGVISSDGDVMPLHILRQVLGLILRSTGRSWRLWCYPGSSRWLGTGLGMAARQCVLSCFQTLPCLAGGALLQLRNQEQMASQ